jgi:hypothetical protein
MFFLVLNNLKFVKNDLENVLIVPDLFIFFFSYILYCIKTEVTTLPSQSHLTWHSGTKVVAIGAESALSSSK